MQIKGFLTDAKEVKRLLDHLDELRGGVDARFPDIAVGIGGAPVERRPALALIANVGSVQGQIALAPDARPDDGLVDLVLATPERPTDWGAMATRVLARQADHPGIERAQVRTLVIETAEPIAYQIDGDTVGACSRLEVSVLPRAVLVMVP